MDNNNTSKLIGGFVVIIIGLVLLTQIATTEQTKTQYATVASEARALDVNGYPAINTTAVYTVTQAPTGWKATDCPLTGFSLTNSTGSALTLTTDYTVNLATGTYLLKNTVNTNTTLGLYGVTNANRTFASYRYCADDYMNANWGRTALDLVPGLFAIVLMLVGVGLFYSVYQDWKQ